MNFASVKQTAVTEKEAFVAIAGQLFELAKEHPKKTAMIFFIELYAHSLIFQHLKEMRDMLDLIPFIHSH